jgi:hypothetical protein
VPDRGGHGQQELSDTNGDSGVGSSAVFFQRRWAARAFAITASAVASSSASARRVVGVEATCPGVAPTAPISLPAPVVSASRRSWGCRRSVSELSTTTP